MLSSPVAPTVVSNPVYREDGPIDLASRHRNVLPENVAWSTTSAKPQIQAPTYFQYGYYPLQGRTTYPIPNIPLGYDYSVKEAPKRRATINESEQKVKRRPPDLNIKKVEANDIPVKPIWRPVSPTVISKGEPPQLSDKPRVSCSQSVGTHSLVPKQANPLRGARGQPLAPFQRGSLVRLANNSLKKVEELNAEDFVLSAQQSPGIQLEKSVIQCLNENVDGSLTITFLTGDTTKVVHSSSPDQPFFVIDRGWCSYNPLRTLELYGLSCSRLQPNDVCMALSQVATGAAVKKDHLPLSSGEVRN